MISLKTTVARVVWFPALWLRNRKRNRKRKSTKQNHFAKSFSRSLTSNSDRDKHSCCCCRLSFQLPSSHSLPPSRAAFATRQIWLSILTFRCPSKAEGSACGYTNLPQISSFNPSASLPLSLFFLLAFSVFLSFCLLHSPLQYALLGFAPLDIPLSLQTFEISLGNLSSSGDTQSLISSFSLCFLLPLFLLRIS